METIAAMETTEAFYDIIVVLTNNDNPCQPSTIPTLSHTRIPRSPRWAVLSIRQKTKERLSSMNPQEMLSKKSESARQNHKEVCQRRHCNVTERCRSSEPGL